MTELIFILTDFCAPAVGEIAMMEQARAAILPRLPALETLLARGHHESLPHDWRAWLAARLDVAPLAPAATVAAAWSAGDNDDAAGADADAGAQPAPYHHWLATPVHFFAGIDRIQLHPAGLLQLPTAEQHTLAGEFAQVFGDSPWRLKARGARELLLAGPPLYASGLDPAGFAGDDPTGGLPQGPDAAALKRLGSEIELWLHEHPLNLERTRRGELAISTLWLWGGQIVPATATAPAVAAALATPPICAMPPHPVGPLSTRLFGRDTYAEALWRLHGASAQPLPRSLAAGPALMDGPADSVLLYPMRHDGSVTAALAQLEQHWLTGAAAALRRRRIEAVQLVIGSSAYRLRWRDLGRLWRARAPWWEKM